MITSIMVRFAPSITYVHCMNSYDLVLRYTTLLPTGIYPRATPHVVGVGFDASVGLPEDVSGKSIELETELGTHT